jgi:hypothetical protein
VIATGHTVKPRLLNELRAIVVLMVEYTGSQKRNRAHEARKGIVSAVLNVKCDEIEREDEAS